LHATLSAPVPTSGLVNIRLGNAAPAGFAIPPKPEPRPVVGVKLDSDRLKAVSENTLRVSELLSKVFAEDGDRETEKDEQMQTEPHQELEADSQLGEFPGLPTQYRGFLLEALSRPEWQRHDLETLAHSHDLMTDGAVEAINEWSFDRMGDALLEDGDPIKVHMQLVQNSLKVTHA
jgi:hypothetical protein